MLDQFLDRHRHSPFVDEGRTVTPGYTVKSQQPISCVAPGVGWLTPAGLRWRAICSSDSEISHCPSFPFRPASRSRAASGPVPLTTPLRTVSGVTTRAVRSCTTSQNIIETCGSADQAAVRSVRKERAIFMEEEAKMGIPNLAHRRRHGQEGQRRCKLAMPKLAISFGYQQPVSMRQPSG
jgi:hypothetical protein